MPKRTLSNWLSEHAAALDQGHMDAATVLPHLAQAGVLQLGVAERLGGQGGDVVDALEAVADIASDSLTAAFICWAQRSFIEYLLESDNAALRERLLNSLLAGELAGATGLSNAMKHLSGIEALSVKAQPSPDGWQLDGRLPWVTNLRKQGFVVAAAVECPGEGSFIAAVPSTQEGLTRSDDLQLMAMQSSDTAALTLTDIGLTEEWLLARDAQNYLPRVRPAFLGLQCGMSIGLARSALAAAAAHLGSRSSLLVADWQALSERLQAVERELYQGLRDGRFAKQATKLFRIRIELAEIVAAAVQLELQASGGKAYLQAHGAAFARRWREAAFVPVITPSVVQLRTELSRQAETVAQ